MKTILLLSMIFAAVLILSCAAVGYEDVSLIPQRSGIKPLICNTNGEPLNNAAVFVVELNKFFYTDETGVTSDIIINVRESYGTVTLLVYRTGYTDCAVYNTVVPAERIRNGPRIRMFEDDGTMPPATVYSENPPDKITYELLKKHRPF